jgi:hypothetical protein
MRRRSSCRRRGSRCGTAGAWRAEGYLAGAVAAKKQQVGEAGASGDGLRHRGIPKRRADDLQHAEPL